MNRCGESRQYAAIAQSVERILGKDEVSGSNPLSSSKNPEFRKKFGIFYIQELLILGVDFSEIRR